LRKMIKIIAEYISITNQYTKDEEEQVEYALRIIVFETLKAIGTIIVFSLMGYPLQAFVAIITMAAVKPYIGGYHEDTQIKCFTATLIIVGGIIYLSTNLSIDFITNLVLNGVSLYCIWHQAPVVNPVMQINRSELIKRNRAVGISISIVFILISIILYKYIKVSNTILWTMVFQALLLFNKRSV
jgi:accessory gene regulator B